MGRIYVSGYFDINRTNQVTTNGLAVAYSDNVGLSWTYEQVCSGAAMVGYNASGGGMRITTFNGNQFLMCGQTLNANFKKLFVKTSIGAVWQTIDLTTVLAGRDNLVVRNIQYSPDSANICWIIFQYADFGGGTVIIKSTDGGLTWTKVYEVLGGLIYFSGKFISDTEGYGFNGSTANGLRVYRTLDGGASWALINSFPTLTFRPLACDYSAQDEDCWILAGSNTQTLGERLVRTNDKFATIANEVTLPSAGYNVYISEFTVGGNIRFFAHAHQGVLTNNGNDWDGVLNFSSTNYRLKTYDGNIYLLVNTNFVARGTGAPPNGLSNTTTLLSGSYWDIAFDPDQICSITVNSVDTEDAIAGEGGSATINATAEVAGVVTFEFGVAPAGNQPTTWQSSINFSNLPPGNYYAWARVVEYPETCSNFLAFTIGNIPAIQANISKSDVTVKGAGDGTITVNITQGSGNYEITYLNDLFTVTLTGTPASNTRGSLLPGLYTVEVLDLETGLSVELSATINEPAVVEPETGDFLFVPFLNPLRFVELVQKDCTILQTPDNTLFCKQDHLGYDNLKYFQKFSTCDPAFQLQFWSSFPNLKVELKDYRTQEVLFSYTPELKLQFSGAEQTLSVFLTNHGNNQSRVYFVGGGLPITVSVGQTFTLTNNADGFNGSYAIAEIQNDTLLGTQYLVINLVYDAPTPSSFGDAVFITSSSNYNIYEALITNLGDQDPGYYYFLITGTSEDSLTEKMWVSEPVLVKDEHLGTVVIEYRNFDDAFDIAYSTGFTGRIRVEANFFKAVPKAKLETLRNTDGSLVKTYGAAYRRWLLEFRALPPYRHEQLAAIFAHDEIKVNGIVVQTEDDLSDPKWQDGDGLADSSITIEQVNWFNKPNSDDLNVVDGGLLIVNDGFLKVQ